MQNLVKLIFALRPYYYVLTKPILKTILCPVPVFISKDFMPTEDFKPWDPRDEFSNEKSYRSDTGTVR